MLFVVGGRDARCPPERLGALFAPGGPAAGTDARAVVLQGLGPSLESGAGEGLEAVQRVVQPVAEFVAALERGGEAGEAATVKECGLAPAASLAPAKPQVGGAMPGMASQPPASWGSIHAPPVAMVVQQSGLRGPL